MLVNNAGGGLHQNFVDTPWERIAKQIQLNVVSLTELTHRFVRAMVSRGRGHVLNVSSIGAYTPSPTYATYSAGKAFVRDFTEAIAFELKDTPVRVCSLCPGGTLTEFHQAAGHELPEGVPRDVHVRRGLREHRAPSALRAGAATSSQAFINHALDVSPALHAAPDDRVGHGADDGEA